ADMGHFGAKPIRRAWMFFVGPALVVNYFGQGALLLAEPTAIKNPFYLLAPQWALIPLVILATSAAIIASQAVISGAFSLTRAAIQMGYCPRLKLMHTSAREIGQVYVPFINWTLLFAFLASDALKVPDGGWFPLLIGAVVFTLLTTWKRGRAMLLQRLAEDTMPLDIFIESITASPPIRVPGTAVFLTSTANRVPHAL